jgi:hypothetical protein
MFKYSSHWLPLLVPECSSDTEFDALPSAHQM